MSLVGYKPLFIGAVASGATKYVEVPIRNGTLGAHIGWKDAVSSATITLELSSFEAAEIDSAGAAWVWKDSGVSITGPAASASDSALVLVENVRAKKARIKIVAAAASVFEISDGTAG